MWDKLKNTPVVVLLRAANTNIPSHPPERWLDRWFVYKLHLSIRANPCHDRRKRDAFFFPAFPFHSRDRIEKKYIFLPGKSIDICFFILELIRRIIFSGRFFFSLLLLLKVVRKSSSDGNLAFRSRQVWTLDIEMEKRKLDTEREPRRRRRPAESENESGFAAEAEDEDEADDDNNRSVERPI